METAELTKQTTKEGHMRPINRTPEQEAELEAAMLGNGDEDPFPFPWLIISHLLERVVTDHLVGCNRCGVIGEDDQLMIEEERFLSKYRYFINKEAEDRARLEFAEEWD